MGGVTVTGPSAEKSLPELPEVEVTRRHLETAMSGKTIVSARVTHNRTSRHNASPSEVETLLAGRKVTAVGRHGKFLVVPLDDGHTLVSHLGMSGRYGVAQAGDDIEAHTHFVAVLDDSSEVRFTDPRTFGFVAVYDESELGESGLSRLGPDAYESPPTADELATSLEGRTAAVKALLLDQGPISGLGNIYADEALFRAGIHPETQGGAIEIEDLERLIDAIGGVLAEGIANGGTTLDDLAYLLPDGKAGENMMNLAVYGREGEPCNACSSEVERIVIRARSTHFCPLCQPERRNQ